MTGFRTFLALWVTQSVSVFGTAITFFAVNIWLAQTLYPRPEQKPELAFALTAFSVAFALPTVLLAPIAGAWADRHDRRRIMMATDVASGLLALLLTVLMATGALELRLLLALVAGFAALGAFHAAAFDTAYALLVPPEQLPRANGMMQTMWALAGILSPALAAVLISLPGLARQGLVPGALGSALTALREGAALAVGLDAVTFLAAAAALLFLRIPSPRRADLAPADGPRKTLWADIREGAAFIGQRRALLWLLATFTVANFAMAPVELLQPLVVKFNLAADGAHRGHTFETALALLASAAGLGGVAGGALVSAWGGLKARRAYGVVVPMLIAGALQVAYGLSPLLYLTAGAAFLSAAMTPVLNAHSQSIWQSRTPLELQGRVFAVRRVIAQFSWPLSAALAGWAGARFNPGAVAAVLGATMVLFCWSQLFNRELLQVDSAPPTSRSAAAE